MLGQSPLQPEGCLRDCRVLNEIMDIDICFSFQPLKQMYLWRQNHMVCRGLGEITISLLRSYWCWGATADPVRRETVWLHFEALPKIHRRCGNLALFLVSLTHSSASACQWFSSVVLLLEQCNKSWKRSRVAPMRPRSLEWGDFGCVLLMILN